MKKKHLLTVISIVFVALLVFVGQRIIRSSAQAACQITNSQGEVIFSCEGNDSTCKISKLGYTLTCDGVQSQNPVIIFE